MSYYIKYPKDRTKKVLIVKTKPVRGSVYGFAEGPIKTKKDVAIRLNQMSVPNKRRPKDYQWAGFGNI